MTARVPRLRSVLAWSGGVLWVLAPIALIVLLVILSQRVRFTEETQTWAPVTASEETSQTPAELAVGWSPGPTVRAPAWQGLVTSTPAAGATTISGGDVVVSIDGIDRIAALTPGPFWRSIDASAAPGRDIRWLNALLRDLGLRYGSGASVSAATEAGIAALAKRLGAGPDVHSFDPAWIVRIPEATLGVGAAKFGIGQPAPEVGAVLFAPRALADVALVTETGQAPRPADLPQDVTDPDAPPPALDTRAVTRLRIDPDAHLMFDEKELALADDRSSLSAEGLSALNTLVEPGEAVVRVLIAHPAQAEGWAVPAAAVYTTGPDRHCVRTDHGPVPVQVLTSEASSVTVTGEVSADDRVLLAVPAGERTCPSE